MNASDTIQQLKVTIEKIAAFDPNQHRLISAGKEIIKDDNTLIFFYSSRINLMIKAKG